MLHKILYLFLILHCANGQFGTCDQTFNLYGGEVRKINSPNYPQSTYPPGSSCRYFITAPSGYELNVKCAISLPKRADGSCYSDYFYIGRDANKTLAGAEFFCGVGNVERTSLFNSVVLAYTSSTTASGWFQCNVTARVQACDCGWAKTSKIVGGTNAGVNEFTSMAGIVYKPNALIFDGGAIIHYRYILTAAHGLIQYKTTIGNLGILVGDHDTSTGIETPYAALYNVQGLIIHENYNTQTNINDIALIQTTSDIVYSRGVAPACLPFNYQTAFAGAVVDTAGWGTLDFGGPVPKVLQKVTLNVIANTQCSTAWGSTMAASQMCTYTAKKDTCQYDSGGSLYYRTTRMYTVGIVSYGYSCASSKPSINTRVTSYLTWIKSKTPSVTYCVK